MRIVLIQFYINEDIGMNIILPFLTMDLPEFYTLWL